MTKVLDQYKGVILFFLVLVIMASMINHHVKKLNAIEPTTINYYEK